MAVARVTFESLKPEDACAVRQLLVDGLTQRWGNYDSECNPDIDNFPQSYQDALVVFAKLSGQVVGTGTLKPIDMGRADIVRMSVAASIRRMGIGSRILSRLLSLARERGIQEVCLETTSSWTSALEFYTRQGFRKTHELDGDSHFSFTVKDAKPQSPTDPCCR